MLRRGVWSDRHPYSVVPESPTIRSRVPHQLSPRRPRRWRWLRRRPRRRRSPGAPARRTTLGCRALPVMAAIPVPVVGVAPARIPSITRAPVRAGRRGRLGPGAGAVGQSQSGQSQPATQQDARTPPDPRSRLFFSRHLPRISLRHESKQVVIPSHLEPWAAETLKRNSTTSPSARRRIVDTRIDLCR
jgi:hypothetical protein